MIRICKSCQSPFRPHQKVPHQKYCSNDTCQKARRRYWQRQKRLNDDDYKQNQYEAQQTWINKNPDYWRKYREQHPGYVERNKRLQKKRYLMTKNASIRPESKIRKIAKMDDLIKNYHINSGYYMLYSADVGSVAKMDPLLVRIKVIAVA